MSTRYLLLKLAEEAGEVVVAAIKHRLHRTKATRLRLEQEIGDVMAIAELLLNRADLSRRNVMLARDARIDREKERMKDRG